MPRLDNAAWRELASPHPTTRAWARASTRPPRLSHVHTGRLRHHRHTSYRTLAGLLALLGIGLSYATAGAGAAGSVATTPAIPTIVAPTLGSQQTTPFVTVAGTCAADTFVLVSRNDIFAGASACRDGGRYELETTLVPGSNSLTVRATTAGGTQSATSPAVATTYTADPAQAMNTMLLRATTAVVVTRPGVQTTRMATLSGGAPPYALKWDFGDGTTQTATQPTDGDVQTRHSYAKAGTYQVTLQIDDASGRSARLGLVTQVGQTTAAAASTKTTIIGGLMSAWPVYVALAILVGAFYLGELRETARLRRREAQSLLLDV